MPAAVEEALRYDAPVQVLFRTATQDVELAGTRIPKGAYVAPLLGSANRDERRFPDPDRFDIDRDPQGHVGFGFGKHFCLGASLARLEARIALERWRQSSCASSARARARWWTRSWCAARAAWSYTGRRSRAVGRATSSSSRSPGSR